MRTIARHVLLGLCLGVAGCAPTVPFRSAHVPKEQAKAGSAHIAVLSIAPWEDYMGALQPTFPMDEERALREAIPNTLDIERRLTDVLALNARIALPSTGVRVEQRTDGTRTSSTTTVDGVSVDSARQADSQADSRTRFRQPGDLSTVSTTTLPTAGTPGAPATSVLESPIAVDPYVRYAAATSLLQEVRVLQRYVRDVMIGKGYRGYVMRLQVTLMPAQRQLPLDAYTTLSFANTARRGGDDAQAYRTFALAPDTQRMAADSQGTRRLPRVDSARAAQASVRVIPIMVSDNLEGATESASSSVLRQFAFGLAGMISGTAASGDAARAVQRLESLLGRQLNSLMTVGQLNDNTLRVRFGAMNQPPNGLGLVPRNQTVTVLLVVPDSTVGTDADKRRIRIASRTDFVNASTGVPLRPQNRKDLYDRLDDGLKTYRLFVDESDPAIARMFAAAQEGEVGRFAEALDDLRFEASRWRFKGPIPWREKGAKDPRTTAINFAEAIWMDVTSILSTHPYTVTTAALPRDWEAPELKKGPRALALDDGKRTLVTVVGASSLQGSSLYATLEFEKSGASVAATSVVADELGRIVVTFPSLSAAGLCSTTGAKDVPACTGEEMQLCRILPRWAADKEDGCQPVRVAYRTTKEAKAATAPGFRVSASAPVVVASPAGEGKLELSVIRRKEAQPSDTLRLRVDGPRVVAAPRGTDDKGAAVPIVKRDGEYILTASATVLLELANLDESVPVVVTATGAEAPGRVQVRVVRAKERP